MTDRSKPFGAGAQIFKKKKRSTKTLIQSKMVQLSTQTPYETFNVTAGCGEEIVRETYYELLKVYHPDCWDSLNDSNEKVMAQDLFFAFKGQFESLLTLEEIYASEQTSIPTRQSFDDLDLNSVLLENSEPEPVSSTLNEDERKAHLSRLLKKSTHTKIKQTYNRLRQTHTEEPPMKERATTLDPKARQEYLDRLHERGNTTLGPLQTAPSQELFNEAYQTFKNHQYARAYELFEQARALAPDNGLFSTYYAYAMFLSDVTLKDRALDILKEVIRSNDRQALSDAYLFAGYIYNTMSEEGEESERSYKFFQRAVKHNPHNHDAERALRLEERRRKRKNTSIFDKQIKAPWSKS